MRKIYALLMVSMALGCSSGGSKANKPDAHVAPEIDAGGGGQPDAMPGEHPDAAVTPEIDAGARADAAPLLPTDIRDIQKGTVGVNTVVKIAGVVTARADVTPSGGTAPTSTILFVQEPDGDPAYSGIMVFIRYTTPGTPPVTLPVQGNLVSVTGTVLEFSRNNYPGSRTDIEDVTEIVVANANPPIPPPVVVPAADLASDTTAEQWEGVLLEVDGVTVSALDPTHNEFTIAGGPQVDDRLYAYTLPFVGDTFTKVIGPLDQDFGNYRVLPRSADDLVGYAAAPAQVTALDPPSASVGVGAGVTMTVTIDRPASGVTVTLEASPADIVMVDPSVTVPDGETSATFTVQGLAAGGPVTLTASFGPSSAMSTITVLSGSTPTLAGLAPDLGLVANGGTGIMIVTLDRLAPAGGTTVNLASADSQKVAVPASVVVPEGETSVGFRLRADATGPTDAPVVITATLDASSKTAGATVGDPTAPSAGVLIINEVNLDPAADDAGTTVVEGDANCDGARSATGDEFIELSNVSQQTLDLNMVSLWDENAFTTANASPRFTFPAVTLGPGESVVVFGDPVGEVTASGPWCTGLVAGAHIGDARAFSAGTLDLSNAGDTVHLTASSTADSLALDSMTVSGGDAAQDQSLVRSPDFATTAPVLFTTATGHATDRAFSPGTLLSGRPFAAASPP